MYAGNVGFSQSLDLMIDAARALPDVTFVINGDGSARASLSGRVAGLTNVRMTGFQPMTRLSEVLATGDIHVVPLRTGLGRVSVPSKIYSILAAGRPVLAAIDSGTEVPRLLAEAGAGVSVPPDDPAAFVDALRDLIADTDARAAMGRRGRDWVLTAASPAAVARRYEDVVRGLLNRGR
jgi:colanic acid biosynthesis glycosyl transferase WcaI